MSSNWRRLLILITALWLLAGAFLPVIAESRPQANINDTATIIPSEEMAKQQGIPSTGPLKETRLDDSGQTMMTTIVAGIFIILPVGIWIFLHQRKKSRK